MDKLLEGYAYDLEQLIRIDGYRGFLLEGGSWQYDEPCLYDLGMRRILKSYRSEMRLVLVGKEEMRMLELAHGCKVSDFLRERGYKCSMIAEYGCRTGKDGKHYGWHGQTWKRALNERRAIFSKNGFALQYKGWADYTFYQFELYILKKEWVMAEGIDIESFQLWNVTEDIMEKAEALIKKALTGRINVTGRELADALKAVGLEDEIEYLGMYERDE